MRLRRWESWVVYTVNGSRLPMRDRRLRRHWTRSGAERLANRVACNPAVLERRINAAEGGVTIRIDGEARLKKEEL